MIVFADPATQQKRAFYTDSQGHVIQYTATFSTLMSDALSTAPRFRLTYIARDQAKWPNLRNRAAGQAGPVSKVDRRDRVEIRRWQLMTWA